MSEHSQSIAIAERSSHHEMAEYGERHLEAALAFRAKHHKQRILKAFGEESVLPTLPKGNVGVRVEESDKRFQKSYDMLSREQPSDIPMFEGEITRDYILSVADNLAWKGIENSITTSHLDELRSARFRLLANGHKGKELSDIKKATKTLKVLAMEDNHFYRDFFDSDAAKKLGVNSPRFMKKIIQRTSLDGSGREMAERIVPGLSLEIAARRYLESITSDNDEETFIAFGNAEEDRTGGDIVVVKDEQIIYIDLKNSLPRDLNNGAIKQGFYFEKDQEQGVKRVVVWPESKEPVREDSFTLNDPFLKESLQKVINATA